MPVNYAIPQPTPGTSRATSPTEVEILVDVSDTIADIDARLDPAETKLAGIEAGATANGHPRQISIIASTPAAVNINWDNFTVTPGAYPLGFRRYTSGAQNDAIGWDIEMDSGTWGLDLLHEADDLRGIYSVRLDGVEVATIDGYAAGTEMKHTTVSGIAVAAAGRKRLTLVMATKNASSAGYYGAISAVTLGRTGA